MRLKRTIQCAKCPWRKDVDPHDIPNGYCEVKHEALGRTIAKHDNVTEMVESLRTPLRAMACHEEHESPCLGWLKNQLGDGNNIALRVAMLNCENLADVRLVGSQHKTFAETLPK